MKTAVGKANLEEKNQKIVRILSLNSLWENAVEILSSKYTSLEFKKDA